MESIGSIMMTSFLVLTITPTHATDPISLTTPSIEWPYYEAGVLVSDYLSLILIYGLIYCLILALRSFVRVSSVNTNSARDRAECDHTSVVIIAFRLVIPLTAIEFKRAVREQSDKNTDAYTTRRLNENEPKQLTGKK